MRTSRGSIFMLSTYCYRKLAHGLQEMLRSLSWRFSLKTAVGMNRRQQRKQRMLTMKDLQRSGQPKPVHHAGERSGNGFHPANPSVFSVFSCSTAEFRMNASSSDDEIFIGRCHNRLSRV